MWCWSTMSCSHQFEWKEPEIWMYLSLICFLHGTVSSNFRLHFWTWKISENWKEYRVGGYFKDSILAFQHDTYLQSTGETCWNLSNHCQKKNYCAGLVSQLQRGFSGRLPLARFCVPGFKSKAWWIWALRIRREGASKRILTSNPKLLEAPSLSTHHRNRASFVSKTWCASAMCWRMVPRCYLLWIKSHLSQCFCLRSIGLARWSGGEPHFYSFKELITGFVYYDSPCAI